MCELKDSYKVFVLLLLLANAYCHRGSPISLTKYRCDQIISLAKVNATQFTFSASFEAQICTSILSHAGCGNVGSWCFRIDPVIASTSCSGSNRQ